MNYASPMVDIMDSCRATVLNPGMLMMRGREKPFWKRLGVQIGKRVVVQHDLGMVVVNGLVLAARLLATPRIANNYPRLSCRNSYRSSNRYNLYWTISIRDTKHAYEDIFLVVFLSCFSPERQGSGFPESLSWFCVVLPPTTSFTPFLNLILPQKHSLYALCLPDMFIN
jgi:hypothetical protein